MLEKSRYSGLLKSALPALLGGVVAMALVPAAYAKAGYPDRAVTIVVPFSTGGTGDLITRIIAQGLGEQLGQAVVVENRAGAAGMIGTDYVIKAKPDGYTLGLGGSTSLTIAPYVRRDKPYDSRTDLTPVGMVAGGPFILATSPKSKVTSLQELVSLAKSRPGELNYGSSGVGSMHHVLAEKFNQQVDIDAVHVPFKGGVESATNLVGGNIDYLFESVSSILPMIQDGRVKALAVTGPERLAALPDVPTVAEETRSGFTGVSFVGIFGPKGLPAEVVSRLGDALAVTLADPVVQERIERLGSAAEYMPSEKFGQLINDEVQVWSDVIRDANIPLM